ncbi:MAG: hypothetical protein L6416_08825 [Candidatus Omnitrophica bacterium]|nr:hypothetical protein [Candidatus Omnitrophota bacterium]
MNRNNLFIQRRFQVQEDRLNDNIHFLRSLYIAYYYFKGNELFVTKYALCVKFTKTKQQLNKLLSK